MSYDLLVFDPKVAPWATLLNRTDFMRCYQELTKWSEPSDYNAPDGLSGNLREFYDRLRVFYPPMNGPDAKVFASPTT